MGMFSAKWRLLKKELKGAMKSASKLADLSENERRMVADIRMATSQANLNNVTRTQAYFAFFKKNPEIHWALLAHLVSRNAGWNMTDLKGEYLPKLLTSKEQTDFFIFLERGNWLIFQDAYPQLLLYEKSRQCGRPLFQLLDALNISKFMRPFWERFWVNGESEELTEALIINEQHYIERRVVHNHQYMETVMDKILFKFQDSLNFNHILFPYNTSAQQKTKIIGGTVHHFSAVDERVFLGRSLYELLFSVNSRLEEIIQWASEHPHSGSRKDFWPQLFNDIDETAPGRVHEMAESPCKRQHKGPKVYSPPLTLAWEDWSHKEAEPGDWFKHVGVLHLMKRKVNQLSGDIEPIYCKTIEEVEMATTAKHTFSRHEKSAPD